MRTSPLLFLLSLLWISTAHAALEPPSMNWRAIPAATDVSSDQSNLGPGLATSWLGGEDADFFPTITTTTDPWVAFQTSSNVVANTPWMITFGSLYDRVSSSNGVSDNPNCQKTTSACSTDVTLEFQQTSDVSQNSNAPTTGWSKIGEFQSYQQLDQFTVNVQPNHWYKIIVHLAPSASRSTDNTIYVTDLGLYDLSVSGPKDYWLMLGASIEVQSISNADWKKNAKALYGADPVVFNMSRGGWLTTELIENLDYFLSLHPNARYAAVHIGGNNVSFFRPWPGGSTILQNDLDTILSKVVAAGLIPVVSRITYRQYPAPNPVLPPAYPQANGSLPYIENIVDPMIKKYNPDFWDSDRQRGYMDGYAWFRANPNLLRDGTHLTADGITVWQQLWVQRTGPRIYGSQPNCSNDSNITCLPAIPDCGNGIVEGGEECDDANRDPNDGCTANCVQYTGANAESLNPNAQVFCPNGDVYPRCDGTSGSTSGSATAGASTSGSVPRQGCSQGSAGVWWPAFAMLLGRTLVQRHHRRRRVCAGDVTPV